MWNLDEVEIYAYFTFDHVLAVRARFLKSRADFVLFNVYAPCDAWCQVVLWDSLSNRLSNLDGINI